MSQNDLSIANQGFASFRSDLNSALQALGSTNSGTSAPSTTYANQLFYDTTNNILKIRNEDNDAFISLFTLDQTNDNIESLTVDGTINLNGTLDMGDNNKILLGAGDDLEIYHDGSNSYIDDSGTGRLFLRGNDRVQIQKYTGEDMITCKSDGAVELFHDNAKRFETTSTGVSVSSSADATMSITAGSTSDDSKIDFVHGSTTDGGITYDHNGSFASEEMKFRTGNNTPNMTLNGSGTLTVANGLTLTDGNLVVASGHGIDFSATQNAPQNSPTTDSELFDDYEEGQWTPSVDGGSSTYGNRIGWYTKIGELVHAYFNVGVNSFAGSSRHVLGGLPYTSKNTTASGTGSVTFFSNIHTNATVLTTRVDANNSSIFFSGNTISATSQTINHSVIKDQTAIFGFVIYRAT